MSQRQEDCHAEFLNGLLDQALELLSEHFDSLRIVGAFMDDENMTRCLTRGIGNWYARVRAVHEFLERDAAQTTAHEIGKVLPQDED